MSWSAYLYDTMTGLLAQRIDVPSFFLVYDGFGFEFQHDHAG